MRTSWCRSLASFSVVFEGGEGDTCVQGVKYFAEMVYGFGEKVCDASDPGISKLMTEP